MNILLTYLLWLLILEHASAQWDQQSAMRTNESNIYTPQNPNGIQYSSGANFRTSALLFFQESNTPYYPDAHLGNAVVNVSVDGLPSTPELISKLSNLSQLLQSSPGLDGGDHQIIISEAAPRGYPIVAREYLNNISYRKDMHPSVLGPGATTVSANVIIDDGHEHIMYEGSWRVRPSNQQETFYFGGFQHTTTTPGSGLTFRFNGTAVYYFSDKSAQNGWAIISVDGGEEELVSTFLQPGDKRWFSQTLCWSKTGLSDGPHTVRITHADQPIYSVSLDFFKYSGTP